jgi:hypothetical protein
VTVTLPLAPAEVAALDRAEQLVRAVLDATPFDRLWIARPELLRCPESLVLRLPIIDTGRGSERADAFYVELPGAPNTLVEAGEAVRRALLRATDHEIRETLRAPDGRPLFDPHGLGDAIPGASRTPWAL